MLGGGRLTLINGAQGFLEAKGGLLTIDTGANTIVNFGLIEAAGIGATVRSPVANSGILKVEGGVLTLDRPVTGSGRAVIAGGTLDFASTFSQNVAFTAAGGMLELAHSLTYGGTVSGFSLTGATSLDLRDIAYSGSTQASYGGTTTSGTLTITDGTHTAHIKLAGNYLASTFTVGVDGHGGTIVTDGPKAPIAAATIHGFVAAMAGHGPGAGGLILSEVRREERPPLGLAAHPFA